MLFEATLYTILWGFLIGILISAPMGPTGMLVIQRTINKGWFPGFLTGLGASLSDFIYAVISTFFINLVLVWIESYEITLQVLGGLLIGVYGLVLWFSNPASAFTPDPLHGVSAPRSFSCKLRAWAILKYFFSGFGLTISNPAIVFLYLILFARTNFLFDADIAHWWLYVIGFAMIVSGAICWWLLITWFINKVSNRFQVRTLRVINRVMAGVMFLIALYGFGNGLFMFYMRHWG